MRISLTAEGAEQLTNDPQGRLLIREPAEQPQGHAANRGPEHGGAELRREIEPLGDWALPFQPALKQHLTRQAA